MAESSCCIGRVASRTSWPVARRVPNRRYAPPTAEDRDILLQDVAIATLNTAAGRRHLVKALQHDEIALLTPTNSNTSAQVVQQCTTACSSFFARKFDEKARHGAGSDVGQQHGYMSMLDDAGSECFEAKMVYDGGYQWPVQPADFRVGRVWGWG